MPTYLKVTILNVFRLPKKCKYSKNGCDFELMPSRKQVVNEHETECPHRDVVCFLSNCSKIVSLAKLLDHLKSAPHRGPVEVIGGQEITRNSSFTISPENLQSKGWISWIPTHYTLNSQEFYLSFIRSPKGLFFFWVYMIGTPKEEEHFTYTISVFDNIKVIFRYR